MVRPCSKNGRRKIAQNSIEVEDKTKESMKKTEEKLDGRNKEGHNRKKPKGSSVGRQKAMESRCRTTYIYICLLHVLASTWPSSGRSPTKEYNNGRFCYRCTYVESKHTMSPIKIVKNNENTDSLRILCI